MDTNYFNYRWTRIKRIVRGVLPLGWTLVLLCALPPNPPSGHLLPGGEGGEATLVAGSMRIGLLQGVGGSNQPGCANRMVDYGGARIKSEDRHPQPQMNTDEHRFLNNKGTKEQRDTDSAKNEADGKKAGTWKLTHLNQNLTRILGRRAKSQPKGRKWTAPRSAKGAPLYQPMATARSPQTFIS